MAVCNVLYEGWQMQCCGTPFDAGETVSWLIGKLGADTYWDSSFMKLSCERMEYYYEAHSSEYEKLFVVHGTVSRIFAVHSAIEQNPDGSNTNIRVPKIVTPVNHANGLDENIDGFEFNSYCVVLENVILRPANKSEVTFR